MQRFIGRMLISLAVIATAVIPIRSDWNDSHVFSPSWSPHARFHGIVSIGMPFLLAPVARKKQGKIVPLARQLPLPEFGATG